MTTKISLQLFAREKVGVNVKYPMFQWFKVIFAPENRQDADILTDTLM